MLKTYVFISLLWMITLSLFFSKPPTMSECTTDDYQRIDHFIHSSDSQGHGPDIGSNEWKQVVEFKLDLRKRKSAPNIQSPSWCSFVLQHLATLAKPAFDCKQDHLNPVEQLICHDIQLTRLDKKMAEVFEVAKVKAINEQPKLLASYQRGWIKGRNDCWKSEHLKSCIVQAYEFRIAELQSTFKMVEQQGPYSYFCEGNRANEVVVSFFDTQPKSLIAQRGDQISFMLSKPSASGSKYKGRNEMFVEHQGKVAITWGYDSNSLSCERIP